MTRQAGEHYVSDVPVTGREGDRLRRWPFAERIADTLASRSDPASLVVGVYGRWCEGKTTVLEFIEQRLADHENVVTVRFNPWLFTNDTDLFTGFFEQVAAAVDRRLESTKGRIGGFLKTYGGVVAGLAGVDLSKVGEEFSRATPQQLRARLEEMLAEEQKRIVVLLDDIDRLDKNEAQAVFRLIKVAADFRWTSYVLALDRDIVAGALAERFPGRREGGDEFLDKIVQVPLQVPPAPIDVLRKLLFDDINRVLEDAKVDLNEADARRFVLDFEPLMPRVATPRAAKRYANALQFVLPLLRGEVDIVELMLIEGLRILHPRLHEAVLQHRDIFLEGGKNRSKTELDEFAREITGRLHGPTDRSRTVLEKLFPRVRSVFGGPGMGGDWETRWAREKRIASERYFLRYFASGVPVGDIADAQAVNIVETALRDPQEAAELLRRVLTEADADRVVQKLIDHAWDATGPTATAVARTLGIVGEELHAVGPFGGLQSPRERAALLAFRALARFEEPRAAPIAAELAAMPIGFALRVLRWMHPTPDERLERDGPRPLTKDEWTQIARLTLPRITSEAAATWILDPAVSESHMRLTLWREVGDAAELRGYVESMLGPVPVRAIEVVRYFAGSSRSLSTGERYQDPLRPDGYESLKSLIAPQAIADALVRAYGEPPQSGSVERFMKTDAELAHAFLRLHAENAAQGQPADSVPQAPAAEGAEQP